MMTTTTAMQVILLRQGGKDMAVCWLFNSSQTLFHRSRVGKDNYSALVKQKESSWVQFSGCQRPSLLPPAGAGKEVCCCCCCCCCPCC
jgi:hypothetical protein